MNNPDCSSFWTFWWQSVNVIILGLKKFPTIAPSPYQEWERRGTRRRRRSIGRTGTRNGCCRRHNFQSKIAIHFLDRPWKTGPFRPTGHRRLHLLSEKFDGDWEKPNTGSWEMCHGDVFLLNAIWRYIEEVVVFQTCFVIKNLVYFHVLESLLRTDIKANARYLHSSPTRTLVVMNR